MCPMLVIMTEERGPGDACPDTDLSDTGPQQSHGHVLFCKVRNIQGSFYIKSVFLLSVVSLDVH